MVVVEILMQVPQRAMIGAVLRSAIEPLLVSALVSPGDITMEPPVLPVIASMPVVVGVVGVVGERRRGGCRHRQHSGRNENSTDGHGTSLVETRDIGGLYH